MTMCAILGAIRFMHDMCLVAIDAPVLSCGKKFAIPPLVGTRDRGRLWCNAYALQREDGRGTGCGTQIASRA
jgi:hypothetical protein